MYCAPHRTDMQRTTGSCLTLRELKAVGQAYNSQHSASPIPKKLFANKKLLWGALSDHFKSLCRSDGKEECWVQHLPDSTAEIRALKKANFRPVKPNRWYSNQNEWLNTYDILLVMQQYDKQYKDFRFVGVFPRDFAKKYDGVNCISKEMCGLVQQHPLPSTRQHKNLGFVFNHDMHNQPGSHWVALFCSFDKTSKKYGAFYYDSVARDPKAEVMQFMAELKRMSGDPEFKLEFNSHRRQYRNTECGIFAMHFLISCLEADKSKSYNDIVKGFGTDDEISALRDILYTPNYVLQKVQKVQKVVAKRT